MPTVTVLFNNDQGSFNARTSLPVEFGPQALAAGNLNADGHADLVVANKLSGTVSILLNDRNGGFLPRQDLPAGLLPTAVAIADHDADGDNDLLSANQGSRDVSVLNNRGDGVFLLGDRIPTGMEPLHLVLSDLTSDIFSDIIVVGSSSPFLAFLENDSGAGFVNKDILTIDEAATRVAVADLNGDGHRDIVVLDASTLRTFLNTDTRALDPPRAPTSIDAGDVPQDLGRRIAITWEAPDLDEQIGRTTEYTVFRSTFSEGPFVEIGRAPQSARRLVDLAATLADTFYYYVTAGNAAATSVNSDTVAAASEPAPFFELELVNEPRLSVGDTLKVRAFLTSAKRDVAGISLYLTLMTAP